MMGLENDQILNSLLVNIRSVIQSCKGGVLLSELQDDYKKFIGACIPFEQFGYNSLETLLKNAPNFVSIKKDSNGQLFAEAVADSSTAHLSSLISKQKNGKSKKNPKSSTFKTKSCGSYRTRKYDVASVWSNSSAADEKDKEIEELKKKLEREKTMNEELSFEVSRLQTELKVAKKVFQLEGNYITQQKYQQEIDDLNSKLEKEKKIARNFSSQVIRLSSLVKIKDDSLSAEQETVKKLKSQIESLESSSVKDPFPVYEYLNSATNNEENWKSLQSLSSNNSWNGHLNLLETDAAKQLNSCNNLSPDGDQNHILTLLKSYKKQMAEQMEKFVTQIRKQNQKLMTLQETQYRNYQELNEKITNCNESLNIENLIEKFLEHPKFLKSERSESRGFNASNNGCQSLRSFTPLSSQSDNDSERSFKVGPLSTFGRGKYGAPQERAYKVKKGYYEISYEKSKHF